MAELVSIIIPAYNAAKTINRCLDSIQKSTYKNLEIIVINDGSKDNTAEIVMQYTEKDPRIRLFTKENGGVSSARNRGLDEARGEYIVFVDSDDYVTADFVQTLLTPCINGADVACCPLTRVDQDGEYMNERRINIDEPFEVTPQEIADDYFKYLNMGVVNFCEKMFRRSVVGDTRFSETLKWGEDGSFNLEIFKKMNRMHVSPNETYYYVIYAGQTTSRKMKGYGGMMVQHMGDVHEYICQYDGYRFDKVKQDMGQEWLRVFGEAVRHTDSCNEYKRVFYEFQKQPWYGNLQTCREKDWKWRLMRTLVVRNHPFLFYSIAKGYEKFLVLKKKFASLKRRKMKCLL